MRRAPGVKSQKTKNPGAPWSQSSRQARRRSDAIARKEQRSWRTSRDQLALLDAKLGKGVGATRERARLAGAP